MSYPYIIQGSNLTVVIGNQPHTISSSHPTYQKLKDGIKTGNWDLVKELVEPTKMVLKFGKGHIEVEGGTLFWKGKPFHNSLSDRIIQMMQDGFNVEPMVNFMENLMNNPSRQSVTELYGFLEKSNLPITEDGHFLAYKKVREDYLDCHSGTMDNSVGEVVEMERNQVDDDRDRTCSTGLHFCSREYLNSFGGARTVIVKINPADVVSIPSDYGLTKGRTCKYEVIGEIENTFDAATKAFPESVMSNASNNIFIIETPFNTDDWPDWEISTDKDDSVEDEGQEYDKHGRALSMTKNAIRKRKARAAKKSKVGKRKSS